MKRDVHTFSVEDNQTSACIRVDILPKSLNDKRAVIDDIWTSAREVAINTDCILIIRIL